MTNKGVFKISLIGVVDLASFMGNIQSSGIEIPILSNKEKFELLGKLGEETYTEAIEMLSKVGKSLIVRPTGFGKTRLLVRMAKEYSKRTPDKRVLYIYPLNIIKTEIFRNKGYMSDGILKRNVDFCSYQELTLKHNKHGNKFWYNRIVGKYSLIILDEVHRAGADGFMGIYDTISDIIGSDMIHIVGATATPNRMMDTEDDNIVVNIFEGNEVKPLTLEDVILLGVMKPPLYAKSMYNTDELVKLIKNKRGKSGISKNKSLDNSGIQMLLSRYLKDVTGAEEFVINSLEQADYNLRKEKYFKFIVFFNDIADVEERGPIVEKWFRDAFNVVLKNRYGLKSKYTVRSHYVTSSDPDGMLKKLVDDDENRSYFNDTDKLNLINKDDRVIDLIMTVNMVNMGYHVENITGVIMLRGTRSEIIYYQQIGRCLSVLNNNRPLIMDFVQNYTEMYDNKFKSIVSGKTGGPVIGYPGSSGNSGETQHRDLILEYSNIEGLDNAVKLANEEYPEIVDKILWLYDEKMAPLCVIASETGLSLYKIKKILDKYGVEIRDEESMVGYIQDYKSKNSSLVEIVPYIYSRIVRELLIKKGKIAKSIFGLFNERG